MTLILLLARAALITTGLFKLSSLSLDDIPLLPSTTADIKAHQKFEDSPSHDDQLHSSNSSTSSERGNLLARAAQNRTRSVSPNTYALPTASQGPKYSYPLVQHAGYHGAKDDDGEAKGKIKVYGNARARSPRRRKGVGLFMFELRRTLGKVLLCGGVWYLWLVWRDRN